MKRKCEYCGTEYFARQGNQRFCNTTCGHNYWRDERRRCIELIRAQTPATYYELELAKAAEGETIVAVGASQRAPLPVALGSQWPDGTEPFHDGSGEGDTLGFAIDAGGSRD
jgi:hypothetical protein